MNAAELPLARTRTDRAADVRSRPGLMSSLLTNPTTRVLLVHSGSVATRVGPRGRPELMLLGPGEAAVLAPGGGYSEGWVFLGYDDVDGLPGLAPHESRPEGAVAYLARLVSDRATAVLLGGDRWTPLRDVGVDLSARDAGLATTAVALEGWHALHRNCPRCGAPTRPESGGWTRRCVEDGSEHYPRTDPAVIMAVVDDADRLLLGHGALWPVNRFSTLAGFVEPGESIEHAVRREVREETGVVVGDVEYRGSQPWPFPASLMLGFRATALSTDITVDGEEVTEARWFARLELRAAVRSGSVQLPSRTSIARALIEEWYGSELPDAL
ncbi:NAD(+) diphosphatase [Cellulomonas chengniuliangii]|uniref:NAD(+) diphosphatase n=1 Tax=Cellulomonas chengniuliangii TaxID=2968084 RepID=A0ABY5KXV5_9CELL|nr:NAD(+) diphosphatase [Cellulomonas chengniuliangii]UUI74683.1 NAD(+) diphosphatase [Cellulomonas chengniuliangii]